VTLTDELYIFLIRFYDIKRNINNILRIFRHGIDIYNNTNTYLPKFYYVHNIGTFNNLIIRTVKKVIYS